VSEQRRDVKHGDDDVHRNIHPGVKRYEKKLGF